ncbi:hypothetical protein LY78DRAFT_687088 [Colletotrichum sublineola]|nr:hypothetical protein LY78DRAFT_687088 [Colletotrichum sublineola]
MPQNGGTPVQGSSFEGEAPELSTSATRHRAEEEEEEEEHDDEIEFGKGSP